MPSPAYCGIQGKIPETIYPPQCPLSQWTSFWQSEEPVGCMIMRERFPSMGPHSLGHEAWLGRVVLMAQVFLSGGTRLWLYETSSAMVLISHCQMCPDVLCSIHLGQAIKHKDSKYKTNFYNVIFKPKMLLI